MMYLLKVSNTILTCKITSSGKIVVVIYSNSAILDKISVIGFDKLFFSIAQIPTTTRAFGRPLSSSSISEGF